MKNGKLPPGPTGYQALQKSFRRDHLEILRKAWKTYGDICQVKLVPGITWFLAIHPEMAERILGGHGKRYEKPSAMRKPLSLLFGQGMLLSEGEHWRRQRRLMQPAFHRQSLLNLASVMTRLTGQTAEAWERYADGTVIDILAEMQQLTLEVVGETLLGADLAGSADSLKRSFLQCALFVARLTGKPVKIPLWFPLQRNREFIANRETLNQIAMEIIRRRRQQPNQFKDLLALLIESRDADTGEGMSDEEIRDEVVTLLFAGHESVSLTLCWTFIMLAKHPEVLRNLNHEIESVLNGNPPKPEDATRLPYTRMVIEETLRLFPPVWFQPREPIADDEIAGYRIPRKSLVVVSSFFTHRYQEFWSNPEEFNPLRFTEAEGAKRHKFAYFPFGGGPRTCIGNQFALMEATLILATLSQRFRLELIAEKPVQMIAGYMLRPGSELPMKLAKLNASSQKFTNMV